jgi:hypothetical protein
MDRFCLDNGLNNGMPFKFTGKIDKVTIDLKPTEAAIALKNKKVQPKAVVVKALRKWIIPQA